MVNRTFKGYLAAAIAAVMWGIQPVLIRKLITENVDTFNIAFIKVLGSAVILGLISLIISRFKKEPETKLKLNYFFLFAILALFGNIFFYHWALHYTFAADVIIIETLSPVFVVIFGVLITKKRFQDIIRSRKLSALFLLLAFGSVGSSLLMFDPAQTAINSHARNIGDLIVTLASITFALYLLMSSEVKKTTHINSFRLMFYFFASSIVLFLPFINLDNFMLWSNMDWLIVGSIAIFFTAFPFLLWSIASGILESAPLVIMFNLAAIFTVISEILFLDLQFSWNIVLSAGIIIFTAYQAKLIVDRSKI